ncbi:unnamed protein product, partial [Brachionus calyciflorus]
ILRKMVCECNVLVDPTVNQIPIYIVPILEPRIQTTVVHKPFTIYKSTLFLF